MDAIGYVRISRKDQSQHSLEYQEKSIREYCEKHDANLVSVFVDDGECSDSFDRADYIALEKFIKSQKRRIRFLIIFDHDRFSRNLPEALYKIEELQQKYNLKVITVNESIDIDTTDPSVFIFRAFKYLVANQELLTIRKRAKDGARHAQESGRYCSQAPFGYLNGKGPDDKRLLVINEETSPIVISVFKDFLSGMQPYLIYNKIKSLGFGLRGNSAVFRILQNPLYAGLVRVAPNAKNPEKFVKGIHKGIITEDQYWRTQELLLASKRITRVQPKEEFPLKGFIKSPCCGGNMTAGWSKGKNKYYLYYRCVAHTNINIPGELLHSKFNELLSNLSFSEEYVNAISKKVRDNFENTLIVRDHQVKTLKKQLQVVLNRIENAEIKLFDEVINGDTYKQWMKKFSAEKSRLQQDILNMEDNFQDKIEQELLILPYMLNLPVIFKQANINQQISILKEVFKHNFTFKDGVFRTPCINKAFAHNLLVLKQKELLEVEQLFPEIDSIPFGGGRGILNISFIHWNRY